MSQSTISRAIAAITPLLGEALAGYVPTAEDLEDGRPYIVDGTLLPCWSWASNPELHSGEAQDHRAERPGRLHAVRTPRADLRPIAGSGHDTHCLEESGVLLGLDPRNWLGDKGYGRQQHDRSDQETDLSQPPGLGK